VSIAHPTSSQRRGNWPARWGRPPTANQNPLAPQRWRMIHPAASPHMVWARSSKRPSARTSSTPRPWHTADRCGAHLSRNPAPSARTLASKAPASQIQIPDFQRSWGHRTKQNGVNGSWTEPIDQPSNFIGSSPGITTVPTPTAEIASERHPGAPSRVSEAEVHALAAASPPEPAPRENQNIEGRSHWSRVTGEAQTELGWIRSVFALSRQNSKPGLADARGATPPSR